jgi:hypothetical protein
VIVQLLLIGKDDTTDGAGPTARVRHESQILLMALAIDVGVKMGPGDPMHFTVVTEPLVERAIQARKLILGVTHILGVMVTRGRACERVTRDALCVRDERHIYGPLR